MNGLGDREKLEQGEEGELGLDLDEVLWAVVEAGESGLLGSEGEHEELQGLRASSSWSGCGTEVEESGAVEQPAASQSAASL